MDQVSVIGKSHTKGELNHVGYIGYKLPVQFSGVHSLNTIKISKRECSASDLSLVLAGVSLLG